MKKNIFLSFAMEDEKLVNMFRGQAKNENSELEFYDYSVKEPFDEKRKTQCREKINQTSMTILLLWKETSKSKAVAREIETSYELWKKVFAVRIDKEAKTRFKIMNDNKAKLVEWNHQAIMNEIIRLSK